MLSKGNLSKLIFLQPSLIEIIGGKPSFYQKAKPERFLPFDPNFTPRIISWLPD